MGPRWEDALHAFEAHLRTERDLSEHSVRGYLTDLRLLAAHATALRIDDPAALDTRSLRSFLATQQTLGRSRATLARRATSARAFTAWLVRSGRATNDPGAVLVSPKAQRTLPSVLSREQVRELLDATATAALDEGPVGLRDVALLEVLYATGIRVGELCGLDVDDLDRGRRLVRVLGKGRKERSVPYGVPAEEALEAWLTRGRPALATSDSGPALLLGARGGRLDQRAATASWSSST